MPRTRALNGTVTALFVKPLRTAPMLAATNVEVIARRGLVGDCHAQPLGPRQVLLIRQEDLDEVGVEAWQVRANIAVRGLLPAALRSGAVLRVGERARLRITHECEVCKVLRRYVGDEMFKRLPGRRGLLAVILNSGCVALGDGVLVGPERFPGVPERLGDRVAWVVARIPRGRVITYDVLLQLVGASRAHARVLPRWLKQADAATLPAHRVLDSRRGVPGHIEGQRDALIREGVRIAASGLLLDDSRIWKADGLYARRS